ncbi:MobV family relaxase [Sphingomonas sanguinis]|uniref:Plasmid recombination enzyme n=1 Tax=Sphingomonas sanguinis TaxID=33051 RepID=A0A147J8K2_9SPHN|nr:MobV family relaxase [Sphingomonas sanguinis]KTW13555.1 hypothetical protein NS258_08805 [Sphingomonas sanguinis]
MKMYAIFTWDAEHGPIKTWDRMTSVEMHNGRTKPIAHGMDGAPPPEFLVGSPKIANEVRHRLADHGIDPSGIRENGVIAHEAIITASREFFHMGSPDEQKARLEKWKQAQVDFATQRYGVHRIASMVLHQDEHTPHIHLVAIPLKLATDGRRRERTPRWGLDNQVLTARDELRQLQTDYGKAMASFGLSRGREGSERKRVPFSVILSDIEAEREAIKLREAEVRAREEQLDACLITLRDGWHAVVEKDREAAAARAAVVSMMADLKRREIEYEGLLVREGRLKRSLDDLNAREAAVAKRERVLKEQLRHRVPQKVMPSGLAVTPAQRSL